MYRINQGSLVRKVNSDIYRIVTFGNFLKCQGTGKNILKFRIFELKSLFISYEFNISDVIAFYVFHNQYLLDSAIHFSYNRLLNGKVVRIYN